jgi:hypothetical protein
MRLLVGGGLPIAGGVVGAGGEISWPGPVRPGAVLHIESEILELRPSRSRPDRGVATVRSETRDQLGEVDQVLVATLVVPRRIQPEMHGGQLSKESSTATSPALHPALTEKLLDPQPGRERVETSPREAQAGGE